ncbi:hypothetical protein [Streptomyces sp. 147326]|uniref:hypothetical protein n=1 Tax=Streptomyces sp. 147326 TaxID=3074379 RepID=UPI00385750E4
MRTARPARDAVDGKDGGRLGGMLIQGRADDQGSAWPYALSDAVVVGRRPCPADPSLVDVTVETGVGPLAGPAEPPSDDRQKRFAFTLSAAEEYTPYGSCAAMPRPFQPRKRPEPVELGLVAAAPMPRCCRGTTAPPGRTSSPSTARAAS